MDDKNNTLQKLHQQLNIPICPYCNQFTELVDGTVIYPHRYDLRDRQFYLCKDCNAYCGCHGNTTISLGLPANAELRKARLEVHRIFDPLWQKENYIPRSSTPSTKGARLTRSLAYRFLSIDMKINIKDAHIGKFNLEQCNQAQKFVVRYYEQCKTPATACSQKTIL